MRAAVLEATEQPFVVRDVPTPPLLPNGALLRVEANGICRSDWHIWKGEGLLRRVRSGLYPRRLHTLGPRLMSRVMAAAAPRRAMLAAIARVRARGLMVAALTNNWIAEDGGASAMRPHFDVVVESAVVALRKPDPAIFRLACRELIVEPPEVVFLDDIGLSLKAARALGMTTIKVEDPDTALTQLERRLGFPLREG